MNVPESGGVEFGQGRRFLVLAFFGNLRRRGKLIDRENIVY